MDRAQLADFLRQRRDGLQPEDVALTAGPRRRTVGLRREEVAALTGMSTDYYTRLEQGRGPQPSEQMLTALARGLRLTLDERDHLYRLADRNVPSRMSMDTHVAPALQRVLDRLSDTPAMVLSSIGEALLQNPMAMALLGDQTAYTGLERSTIYRWFTNPRERQIYPKKDHARQSKSQVANLRAAYGAAGKDSRAGVLVSELLRVSAEFTDLWGRHEVARRFEQHKTLVHPQLGEIELDCQVLFTEDQAQALLVLTAAPRTEAHDKLRLLAVLGQEQFSASGGEAPA